MIQILAKQKKDIHIHVTCKTSTLAYSMADAIEKTGTVEVKATFFIKEAESAIFVCERLPGYDSETIIDTIRTKSTVSQTDL